jgi:dTDP-4-amino-4,6-dideoxygalactose transaminase
MSDLALFGGPPAKTKPFPVWPVYDDRERQALLDVLESRVWWRTPGTQTLRFEQRFAQAHGARHGIAVTNGTAALEVVMLALGIGPGDEVIVPDYTFFATASAVLCAGALPVMVDIRPDTSCIDPDLVAAAITPRTKAIVAVHLGGHPADLDALGELAKARGLPLVEDCAHAHGSAWRGQPVGSHGIAGTFSFQMGKLMTAGEGGIVITNDDAFERQARSVHDCGRLPGEWFYSHFQHGSNYRLSEWQGAILGEQLERLDEQAARRQAAGRWLDQRLAELPGITPQSLDARCTRNGQYAYIFDYDPAFHGGLAFARFAQAVEAEGVPRQAAYPPVHALDLFRSGAYRQRLSGPQRDAEHAFLRGPFPQTIRAAQQSYWIPQTCLLGDEQDLEEMVGAVRKVLGGVGSLA